MVLEGLRLFERALAANATPTTVVVGESLLAPTASQRAASLVARLRGVVQPSAIHATSDARMRELCEGRTFGDIVGLVSAPRPPALDTVLADATTVLVAADVLNPGNVGALVRSAHAGGAAGLVILGGADPHHGQAVRASMGSVFRVPVWRFVGVDAVAAIGRIHAAGLATVGLTTTADATLRHAHEQAPRAALVVGGEAFGLKPSVAELLSRCARIPMPAGVDSLSVNAAAAVALYEWTR